MTKPKTSFWRISLTLRGTDERWTLVVQAPASYDGEKVCETLQSVHPEYTDLSAEQIERPEHIKEWGVDD